MTLRSYLLSEVFPHFIHVLSSKIGLIFFSSAVQHWIHWRVQNFYREELKGSKLDERATECIEIVHAQRAYYFYLHCEFSGQVLGLVEIMYRLKLPPVTLSQHQVCFILLGLYSKNIHKGHFQNSDKFYLSENVIECDAFHLVSLC